MLVSETENDYLAKKVDVVTRKGPGSTSGDISSSSY